MSTTTDGARPGHHLAQINIGRLLAEPGDPRVAAFMGLLDRVNGLGRRMPGFVWIMEGSGEPGTGNTEARIGGDPRFVSNLTVRETVGDLGHFVWNTLHRQVYARRAEWFELLGAQHFAMWWVPAGHRPTLDEGLAAIARRAEGDSDAGFGWGHTAAGRVFLDRRCAPVAAE